MGSSFTSLSTIEVEGSGRSPAATAEVVAEEVVAVERTCFTGIRRRVAVVEEDEDEEEEEEEEEGCFSFFGNNFTGFLEAMIGINCGVVGSFPRAREREEEEEEVEE